MYETYYDTLQRFLGHENLHVGYMDCDSLVSTIKMDYLLKDLIKLPGEKKMFYFNKIAKDQLLLCNKITDVIGISKIETPDTTFVAKFCSLRPKAYAYYVKRTDKENGERDFNENVVN